MLKKLVSPLLIALCLLIPIARTANAKPQKQEAAFSADQIKMQITKLGVGEKARGTVTLKDGTKVKGYVYQAGDEEFVIRDRKTNVATTIRYADVIKVQPDRGHSTAKHLGIGIAVGVGAFVGILLLVFAHLND